MPAGAARPGTPRSPAWTAPARSSWERCFFPSGLRTVPTDCRSKSGPLAAFLRSEASATPTSFPGGRVWRVFRGARERTSRWMGRHAGRSDGALYLLSLTTGEVPPSSHPMVTLLRKTGLAHLLAISGINVAIFFITHSFLVRGVIWAFRRRQGTPDLNRISTLLSVPVCWAYVFMAGARGRRG